MRTPEETSALHGERLAAREAINNTPFNDELPSAKVVFNINGADLMPDVDEDYSYEVSMQESGSGFVYTVVKVTRTYVASAADYSAAHHIVQALEQYEGV